MSKKKDFTEEEIQKGLWCCSYHGDGCDECPYEDIVLHCTERLTGDALDLIKKLKGQEKQ